MECFCSCFQLFHSIPFHSFPVQSIPSQSSPLHSTPPHPVSFPPLIVNHNSVLIELCGWWFFPSLNFGHFWRGSHSGHTLAQSQIPSNLGSLHSCLCETVFHSWHFKRMNQCEPGSGLPKQWDGLFYSFYICSSHFTVKLLSFILNHIWLTFHPIQSLLGLLFFLRVNKHASRIGMALPRPSTCHHHCI